MPKMFFWTQTFSATFFPSRKQDNLLIAIYYGTVSHGCWKTYRQNRQIWNFSWGLKTASRMRARSRILFLTAWHTHLAVYHTSWFSHCAHFLETFLPRLAPSDSGDGLQSRFLFQTVEVFIPGHISEQTSVMEFQSVMPIK